MKHLLMQQNNWLYYAVQRYESGDTELALNRTECIWYQIDGLVQEKRNY